MATYSVAQAKEQLEDLLDRAGQGEEIIVANDMGVSVTLALLKNSAERSVRRHREPGRLRGVLIVPDDICDPVMSAEDYEAWMSKL